MGPSPPRDAASRPSTGAAAPAALVAPWAPLRVPIFRRLWLATVASNLGTWIQEVAAAWLMTSLAPAPLMVAAVQAASSLPMFLLALPAGALADLVDRRRLLVATQSWMAGAALGLGVLTVTGRVTPWTLLAFTFGLALGNALNSPAWQATVPEMAGGDLLPSAVALNSLGFNVARAVGPALGGLLLAFAGAGANFLVNAASFVGVVLVLWRWRRRVEEEPLPGERLLGAVRAGARYVRHSPRMHAVLARSGAFVLFGSALWALLPLVARFRLGAGPGGYGLLLGAFGTGAVSGAANLHRLRRHFSFDRLAAVATVVFAGALAVLALSTRFLLVLPALAAAGGAWLTVLSGFNVAAQTSVPGWVRGRALATYLLVFYGSMAAGSAGWGWLAEHVGIATTLGVTAAGLLLGLALLRRFPIELRDTATLAPSRHWPAPLLPVEPEHERGPVLITVSYRVEAARAADFVRAMRRLGRSRRRTGALRWGLWQDAADPQVWIESFVDESWLEHLRHHERVTGIDAEIEREALAFHLGPEPPEVRYFLAAAAAPTGTASAG